MARPDENLDGAELRVRLGIELPDQAQEVRSLTFKGVTFARFHISPSDFDVWSQRLPAFEPELRPRGMELKLDRDWWLPKQLSQVQGLESEGLSVMAGEDGERVLVYLFAAEAPSGVSRQDAESPEAGGAR